MNIANSIQTSQAEVFFRSLSDDPATAFAQLSALVQEKAEENEWRDFKEAAFIDAPLPPPDKDGGQPRAKEQGKRDEDVKRLWSENLSAFANSSGGVLIWGIRTKKERDSGIDKAESLSLAADALRLADRLRQLQNDMVDPPVQGVEIRAVTEGPQVTAGFVVCLISESIFKPHRAIRAENGYYFRVDDSNRQIPTAMLRALFHPTFAPRLVPRCTISLVPVNYGSSWEIQIRITMINRGMASALNACIKVDTQFPACSAVVCTDRHQVYIEDWEKRPFSKDTYERSKPIHPAEEVQFRPLKGENLHVRPKDEDVFEITFHVFAQNAPGLHTTVTFTGAELSASLESGGFMREGMMALMCARF